MQKMTSKLLASAGLALVAATSAMAAGGPEVLNADGTPAGQSSPVEFVGNLMFWELISFGLLLIALRIIVFPKMFAALKRRQKHIEDALEKADRVNKEAEELLKKHEKMLSESHAEAKRITDEAIAAGERAREDLIGAAKKDADGIVKHAKAEIRRAQDSAMESIRTEAVELSLLASTQLLERSLNDDDHRRLATQAVESAVSAFSSKN